MGERERRREGGRGLERERKQATTLPLLSCSVLSIQYWSPWRGGRGGRGGGKETGAAGPQGEDELHRAGQQEAALPETHQVCCTIETT